MGRLTSSLALRAQEDPRLFGYLHRNSASVVTPDTEVVVEAFPRSGNTFAVTALRQAQGRKIHLAHHTHVVGQLALAERLAIPTLTIIRDPIDASASLLVRHPETRPGGALRRYLRFYNYVYDHRQAMTIGSFATLKSDFGMIIDRLNEQFGLSLARFHPSPENLARVFSAIDRINANTTGGAATHVARPAVERDQLLAQYRDVLAAHRLAGRAGEVFRRVSALAV